MKNVKKLTAVILLIALMSAFSLPAGAYDAAVEKMVNEAIELCDDQAFIQLDDALKSFSKGQSLAGAGYSGRAVRISSDKEPSASELEALESAYKKGLITDDYPVFVYYFGENKSTMPWANGNPNSPPVVKDNAFGMELIMGLYGFICNVDAMKADGILKSNMSAIDEDGLLWRLSDETMMRYDVRLHPELRTVYSGRAAADEPSSWAKDSVAQAKKAGIVPASLQSAYASPITRAEFCALATQLYETVKGTISGRTAFTDTIDVNVQKMASLGVVNGVGNGRFDPDGTLTREQAATMLARLAGAMGKPLAAGTSGFADDGSISSWALGSVGQMKSSGIMSGVGGNKFDPKGSYTREQSIITVLRLYNIVK